MQMLVAAQEGHSPLKTPVILRLQLLLGGVPGEGRRTCRLECEDHLRDVQRLVRLVLQEYAHMVSVMAGFSEIFLKIAMDNIISQSHIRYM